MTAVEGRALHHCIHVLDLDKSLEFYDRALGLAELRRIGPEDGSWCNVFLGNATTGFQLELTWNNGRTEPYDNGVKDTHMAFAVPDYEAAHALHKEMGVICFENEKMGLYFIADPDGCWIEILPDGRGGNKAQTGVDVLYAMHNRRSVRTYTDEFIPGKTVRQVVEAGLLAAAGRGIRPWELIVVRQPEMLAALAECREMGSAMLAGASAAVVVVAKAAEADTWIEDSSLVMGNMLLAADALGLGGCWVHGRDREKGLGVSTDEYVRGLLKVPDDYTLEAILSLGVPAGHPAPNEVTESLYAKVHHETF